MGSAVHTLALAALIGISALGCDPKPDVTDAGAPSATAQGSAAPVASTTASAAPKTPPRPTTLVGAAIARTAEGDALVVADEDHRAIRTLSLPLDEAAPRGELALPGAPAQVVALAGRVLVTVRDPGMLLVLDRTPSGLVEAARVALSADAWGLAVSSDEKTALITSAWTHKVTAVDLETKAVRWTAEVGREPRGVVAPKGSAFAYVSHLVGPELTRVDLATGDVRRVGLPASPLRTPAGKALGASLGFSVTADDERLFVARHALGALGTRSWFGASTVDVLMLADESPLAPRRPGRPPFLRADKQNLPEDLTMPGGALGAFTQPRAVILRKSTRSLLVVSEGLDALVELDAAALDPSNAVMRTYAVGSAIDPYVSVAMRGAAPQGVALSADEATAYVFCRASYDVVAVALDDFAEPPFEAKAPVVVGLATDPLGDVAAMGRRLFYNATDTLTSGGLGCNGCHPDGRDDGHVWHEARINTEDGTSANFVGEADNLPEEEHQKGYARRTPMLAGRIAQGPYGWHAESPDLASRLGNGFGLHRWGALPRHAPENVAARATYLVAFVRVGLTTPPREERPMSPTEVLGEAVFKSEATRCAKCHLPEADFTDRTAYPLAKLPPRAGFDDERDAGYKTPSLRFLDGRAPYFHDGSASSLDTLVERNGDRMGRTNHLSREERAALVAFLKTL